MESPDHEIYMEDNVGYARYANHIKRAREAFYIPRRQDNMKVYLLVGPTGTGKTYWAYQKYEKIYQPIITKDKIWWDGYNQESVILLDDYRGEITYSKLLTLLDKYPKTGEVKCSSVALNYSTVIITSNHHISEWYPNLSHSDLDPLRRRIQTGGLYEIRQISDTENIQ